MRHFLFSFLLICWSGVGFGQRSSSSATADYGLSFIPDNTFHGSNLTGWHVVGKGSWGAKNGLITGKPEPGSGGSLLVLDTSYQDVGFHCLFKLSSGSQAAIIMRITKVDEGMKGVMLSLKAGDVIPYAVSFDADGKITSRKKLRHAGGINYRIAPPPDTTNHRTFHFRTPPAPPSDIPVKQPNSSLLPEGWNIPG